MFFVSEKEVNSLDTRSVGNKKEEIACEYLKDKGYSILKRNFSCHFGEIDIIAKFEHTLVFVEVKYRGNAEHGTPEQAVTSTKRRRIIKTADYYRVRYQVLEDVPCRFDVIAITGRDGNIKHFQNAFDYYGEIR